MCFGDECACPCRVTVMAAVRVIAFWKKGVLLRGMGKEAMALECTNCSGSEKHIDLVAPLAASRSPVPLAALCWAGAMLA